MKNFSLLFILLLSLILPMEIVLAADTTCTGNPPGFLASQTAGSPQGHLQGWPSHMHYIEPNLLTNSTTVKPTIDLTANQIAFTPAGWQSENTYQNNTGTSADTHEPAADIINGIFNQINAILSGIEESFYLGVVGNANFQAAVTGAVVLYLTIYGMMIIFNMASYRQSEIIIRLVKIGLVWAITDTVGGWTFFFTYVGNPIMTMLNSFIVGFMSAVAPDSFTTTGGAMTSCAGGGACTSIMGTNGVPTMNTYVNPITMIAFTGVTDLLFSVSFVVMLLAHFSLPFGWLFCLAIMWGMVEFVLMFIGAMVTYVKAIVGLFFLFGLAPIFFTFILFDQTKKVFMGWVNQVFAFFMQPVVLFAYLSFYMILLKEALINVMFYGPGSTTPDTTYCWVPWLHFIFFDLYWWRPINANNTIGGNGSCWWPGGCGPVGTKWHSDFDPVGGDWAGGAPISIIQIMFFLLIAHIGKHLGKFVEEIAQNLSGGEGAGTVKDNDVSRWMANYIPGMKGRGVASLAQSIGEGAISGGKSAYGWAKQKRANISTKRAAPK